MTDLSSLARAVCAWHDATFPDAPPRRVLEKLLEETQELEVEVLSDSSIDLVGEEAADVFIALVAFCNRAEIDLPLEVASKMGVNRRRRWDQAAMRHI